ncbi:hypothetical protein [Rugamonas sp. DEMB1]|jgi:hypothetical protein|uniref:antitoxin PaaA2 family protein n=1 Tax=Rugamonas sp. DEMB1 TaxID=3039386 RepID=UPI00391DEB70
MKSYNRTQMRPSWSEWARGASKVKAHTEWMRQKVAESLADPAPNLSHAQVMADVQALIDAVRKRQRGKIIP